MQFSRNSSRFAVVAALHVGLGAVFIHGMSHKTFLSHMPEAALVMLTPEAPVEPPPPPDPPHPMPTLAPPDLVVPRAEVDVAPPPQPAPAMVTADAEPTPFPSAPAVSAEPPAAPGNGTGTGTGNGNGNGIGVGQMHTAVLADAKSCALPDYPARAARNGDSGTTTLALLVGVDGRVSSARVDHSSGSRDLDRAAVSALSLCRFKPATNNGVAEAGWAQLAYVWTLE